MGLLRGILLKRASPKSVQLSRNYIYTWIDRSWSLDLETGFKIYLHHTRSLVTCPQRSKNAFFKQIFMALGECGGGEGVFIGKLTSSTPGVTTI